MAATKWPSEETKKYEVSCCRIRLYLILTTSKTKNMRVLAEVLMTETNEKALTK